MGSWDREAVGLRRPPWPPGPRGPPYPEYPLWLMQHAGINGCDTSLATNRSTPTECINTAAAKGRLIRRVKGGTWLRLETEPWVAGSMDDGSMLPMGHDAQAHGCQAVLVAQRHERDRVHAFAAVDTKGEAGY